MKTYFASFSKRTRMFWGGLLIATIASLLLAACGGTADSTQAPAATPTATATTAPTPTPTVAAPPVVKTGTAKTKSGSKTVLTDVKGLTLYYFDLDTATTSSCTSSCAKMWIPLLFTGSGQPTASVSLPGQLTVVSTANGMQVAYNGHLLYTYDDDVKAGPGFAKGDGEFGKWHVVTPDVTAAK